MYNYYKKNIGEMISGFNGENINYRTRVLHFPSTLESTPSITKPAVHVIKIRFNNIFKNDKVLFGFIAVSLSIVSLFAAITLFYAYNRITAGSSAIVEELASISEGDVSTDVMSKTSLGTGGSAGIDGNGSYIAYNGGGGIDPNSLLLASNDDKKPSVKKVSQPATKQRAVVEVDDKTDINPFLPIGDIEPEKKEVKKVKINPNYILPPGKLETDSDADLLMKTSVSGIMYDNYSPSAIIKINNTDYFVKNGDIVQGFTIVGIKPKTVVIKRGTNIFDANVGQILATLEPNTSGTDNINKKFGGSYGQTDKHNINYKKGRK